MLDGGHGARGRLQGLIAALAPDLGQGGEHPRNTRPPIAVFAGNVGSAEVGSSVGGEKGGQGPSSLAADGRDGRLVTRIHVRPFVAVHFHRDIKLIDEGGDLRVLVGLAVHDVAPVAPDGANVQQDWLVLGLGEGKGRRAPGMPLDGLMARRAQVGAG